MRINLSLFMYQLIDITIESSFIPIVLGVPYPASFETPTTWSETEFVLSWRLNCSIHAPPIIDYQLEFRQSGYPRTKWIKVNIPAHEIKTIDNNAAGNTLKNTHDSRKWSETLFIGNSFDHGADEDLGGHHSRYRGTSLPKLTEFRQSYALRGLSRSTNYEVSFLIIFYSQF